MPFNVVGLGEALWDVLPSGKHLGGGAVKAVTSAAYNSLTGAADAPVSIITGEAVAGSAVQLTEETLETAATGVGIFKVAADFGTYAYGFAQCR